MKVKPGVVLPAVLRIYQAAQAAYGTVDPVITSGMDGNHKRGSKHYLGHALDFRIWHVDARKIRDAMAAALGPDYDVIAEKDHIHAEYDPKG